MAIENISNQIVSFLNPFDLLQCNHGSKHWKSQSFSNTDGGFECFYLPSSRSLPVLILNLLILSIISMNYMSLLILCFIVLEKTKKFCLDSFDLFIFPSINFSSDLFLSNSTECWVDGHLSFFLVRIFL